jgi:hypothetical protein
MPQKIGTVGRLPARRTRVSHPDFLGTVGFFKRRTCVRLFAPRASRQPAFCLALPPAAAAGARMRWEGIQGLQGEFWSGRYMGGVIGRQLVGYTGGGKCEGQGLIFLPFQGCVRERWRRVDGKKRDKKGPVRQ